jgi:hypothetical protein
MQIISNTAGNPPPSIIIYERLFSFIDNVLPDFKVFSKKNNGDTVDSEDAITEDLSDYLDLEQENLKQDINVSFKFTNQSQRKTDIGVKWGRVYNANNRNPFCWIEAKRLPTPKEKNRDAREYVIVNQEKVNGAKKFKGNGGIQRFKENKHAHKLPFSIMIGYIQEKNANYWLEKINALSGIIPQTKETNSPHKKCYNLAPLKYPAPSCLPQLRVTRIPHTDESRGDSAAASP